MALSWWGSLDTLPSYPGLKVIIQPCQQSSSGSVAHLLCDLGRITVCFWASIYISHLYKKGVRLKLFNCQCLSMIPFFQCYDSAIKQGQLGKLHSGSCHWSTEPLRSTLLNSNDQAPWQPWVLSVWWSHRYINRKRQPSVITAMTKESTEIGRAQKRGSPSGHLRPAKASWRRELFQLSLAEERGKIMELPFD